MARFRRSVFASILVALASCTTGGVGGGGGLIATGGIAGTPCAAAQAKGCLVQGSSASIMLCGTDGNWSLLASCTAGQYCSETYVGGIANPQCLGGNTGTDAGTGGDTATGGDSSTTDASINDTSANDTIKPVEVCGDGKCGDGETDIGCPTDCAKKAVCGNFVCEVGESTSSCPGDCKSGCEPMCTGKQCGSNGCGGVCGNCGQGKACTDEGQCVTVGAICGNAKCEAGESYSTCPSDCEAPTPVCGNGKCEAGESTATCKADCPGSGPVCGNGNCESGESTANCKVDCPTSGPVCGNSKCETGEDSGNCPADCGLPTPVCGDGTCEPPEDSASCEIDCPATGGSCVGKCGGESTGCMCDDQCTQYGDCCGDYKTACGGSSCTPKCASGATCGSSDGCGGKCAGSCSAGLVCNSSKVCVPNAAKCGNGVCESGESPTSCAADCKTASGSCNGMCGKASGSCYCDTQCKSSNDCCADYDKYCGSSTGPVCGNGKCESGEAASNCTADCGGSSSMCPNGKCEAGETEASCPQDCKLGCYGDFSLGSTFYKSGDTKQTGLACDNKAMPKNCPDGYWITFPDSGECVCILSCAGIGVSVGQNCTTDGAWKCQDILATNASANGGKMCVPTKWGLCSK